MNIGFNKTSSEKSVEQLRQSLGNINYISKIMNSYGFVENSQQYSEIKNNLSQNKCVFSEGDYLECLTWYTNNESDLGHIVSVTRNKDKDGDVYYTYTPYTVMVSKYDDKDKPWLNNFSMRGYRSVFSQKLNSIAGWLLFILALLTGYNWLTKPSDNIFAVEAIHSFSVPSWILLLAIFIFTIFVVGWLIKIKKTSLESISFNQSFKFSYQDEDETKLRELFSPSMQMKLLDHKFRPNVQLINGYIILNLTGLITKDYQFKNLVDDLSIWQDKLKKEVSEEASIKQYRDNGKAEQIIADLEKRRVGREK